MTIRDRVGNTPDNLGFKAPCRVATTANVVLSGLQTIDGVALVAGDRVLVWKQTDAKQNGIYQASTGAWTRPHDADNNEAFINGTQVYVVLGTVNGNLNYAVTTADDPIVIGTSLLNWFVPSSPTGVTSARQILTTAPLTGGGNLAADRTLALSTTAVFAVAGGALDLAANGVTYAKLQQVAANRLLGNATGAAASVAEISLGATLAFSGSALQTAALTGDVTANANSFVTAIASNAVTNAKIRQSAALSVIGNAGSTTGNVADIAGSADQVLRVNSLGTALAFGAVNLAAAAAVTGTLALANGGTGASTLTAHGILLGQGASPIVATAVMTDGQLLVGQSAADPLPKTLSGDATLAASGALTIAAGAVTYAKIQNVSVTQRVLGRNSAGAGVAEEVSASSLLDWLSSTRGALLRRGATGWEPINPGTAGTVLTSNGTGTDPTYQALAGTGTVTNVATGFGLTGGPISTSGTLSIATSNPPYGVGAAVNLQLNASVAANALTIAVKTNAGADPAAASPVLFPFRDATLANGDPVWIAVTSALSLTIAAGNTMGTSNNVPFRLWIVAFNNAGTVVLGAINCLIGGAAPTAIFPLAEHVLQTSSAASGNLAAGVFATTSAIAAGKAICILGYVEYASGLTVAGTYASAPTQVELFGPGVKKPGDVVQAKSATYSASAADAAGTETDSGLTASVTPTSAANPIKIALAQVECYSDTPASTYGALRLKRGATTIQTLSSVFGLSTPGGAGYFATLGGTFYDAPGAATAQTYKTTIQRQAGLGTVRVQNNNGTSSLLLEELMA